MHYWAPGPDGTIDQKIQNWEDGKYRGDLLYGLTHLKKEGFDVIFPNLTKSHINGSKSWLPNLIDILKEKRKYDFIYAPYSNGLQGLIYLRGLRLFKKKIIIWQHAPIEKPRGKNFIRRFFYRVYLNGIDKFIFFGEAALSESITSGIVNKQKTAILNWGADLVFFNAISKEVKGDEYEDIRFISTGVDNRDFETLTEAFKGLSVKLDIYFTEKKLFEKYRNVAQNISVYFIEPNATLDSSLLSSYFVAKELAKSSVSVICSKPILSRKLSFGLTSLIEATALGKPVIVTRNKYIPKNFESNKVGLFVDAGNVTQLRDAVIKMSSDKNFLLQLGNNSKRFAVERCNLEMFTKELAFLFQEL